MLIGDPERNLEALRRWREQADAKGYRTPDAARLVSISREPKTWSATNDDALEQFWAGTVDHLLGQVGLGVVPAVAVDNLPRHLRDPSGTPRKAHAAAQPHNGDEHPGSTLAEAGKDLNTRRIEAAIEWRRAQIEAGVEGADEIKDITLRNLVKNNQTSVDQIRKRLTGTAKALAPQLAEVLAGIDEPDIVSDGSAPASAQTTVDVTERTDVAIPLSRTGVSGANGSAGVDSRTSPFRSPDEDAGGGRPGSPPLHDSSAVSPSTRPPSTPQETIPFPRPAFPGTLELGHADFSDYEYPETDVEPGRISIKTTPDGIELTWEPVQANPGDVVVYRLVSSDDVAPHKPEAGESVAVTLGTKAEDTRFLTSAVRIYQVWCHVGADENQARRSQATKWADGEEVSPVDGMTLTEEAGRVIGRWSVFPGTRAVQVFRIPLDGGGPAVSDPRNQICVGQPNLTGFVDGEAPRGHRYLYRAQSEVSVNGSLRLSRAKAQEILVSVELKPIDDLAVEMSESRDTFDLRWTTPESGQHVRVYRFESPPPAGLESEDRDESVITVQGFTDERLIKEPITALDPATSQIAGVLWPAGWERAYLTPVTVSGDRVRIGTTRVQTRPLPAVVEPRIIERFHTEIVTFGWPAGAASVLAFVGFSGTPEQICAGGAPIAEVSASQHKRDGALTFPRPLQPSGCTVCLVPVAYSRGEQIRGEISALHYPGLDRLSYWFEPVPSNGPAPQRLRLVLNADHDIENPPPLVLVNNEQRLPLEPRDGRYVQLDSPQGPVPHCVLQRIPRGAARTDWTFEIGRMEGYMRLFVYEEVDRSRALALHDPLLQNLTIPRQPQSGQPGAHGPQGGL